MAYTLPGNIKAKINQNKFRSRLTIIFGCLIVSIWTLIRFFNHSPNFDQVGQQVLAHQWLSGLHSGSVIGPTNYVLKMLFLYIPFGYLPVPGQFKLVAMTLLVNILTFVLLVYVLKKLWNEFFPNLKDYFDWPLLYLALISGSVYWIAFSNSRNLEVVGGLWFVYLSIRAQAQPSRRYYVWLILLGSLLFFADPLQIYMTLVPALLFVGLRWFAQRERQPIGVLIKIIACAAVGTLLAHILTRLVESIWNISFINTEQSLDFSLPAISSALKQMARLYAGGFEGGRLREVVDLLVVAATVVAVAYYAWRNPKSRWLFGLVGLVWVVDLAVYIVSGQAQQTDTGRYLIMTVSVFILAIAAVLYYLPSKVRTYTVTFVLLLNTFTLAQAFAKAWNPRFANNNHSRSVISYFKNHNYSYGYASIGTALSSDYLSNWQVNVLPLGCDSDYVLKQTNLFFDKAGFNVTRQVSQSVVPIVLDGDSIKINSAACGASQAQSQLGPPQTIQQLSDGSTVLLYKASQLHNLRPPSN